MTSICIMLFGVMSTLLIISCNESTDSIVDDKVIANYTAEFPESKRKTLIDNSQEIEPIVLKSTEIFSEFNDGEIFVKIDTDLMKDKFTKFKNNSTNEILIIQSGAPEPNKRIMELSLLLDALSRSSLFYNSNITLCFTYFPYSRQDRVTEDGTPISAKVVADMITRFNTVDRLITFDLHSAQVQGYVNIPFNNINTASLFAKKIKDDINFNKDNTVVIAPDAGASLRARSLAKELGCDYAIVEKIRSAPGQSAVTGLIIGADIKDKRCIIFDDMVAGGGTLCNAADILIAQGAKSVDSCITHPLLIGQSIKRINNSKIEHLYVCNTISTQGKESSKISVVDISNMLFSEWRT